MAEALRLADELDDIHTTHVARNAAAELRRLHELLEAEQALLQRVIYPELQRLRTQRDALLEALEAMQSYAAAERKGLLICDESITVLRAALAQEEQEPVAWQWLNSAYFRRKPPANAESGAWSPLYTAPPRREWKVLTNEELNRIESQARSHDGLNLSFLFLEIQQALKEKNNG